jgi:hypothetical protein
MWSLKQIKLNDTWQCPYSTSVICRISSQSVRRLKPVAVVALYKGRMISGRSNTRIVGLNLARGVEVCPLFSDKAERMKSHLGDTEQIVTVKMGKPAGSV